MTTNQVATTENQVETNKTEKIRPLVNKVVLAGALAELSEPREGKDKNGIPYLSFNGVVQCGESQVNRMRFQTYVKSKKSDGTESKIFSKVKQWVYSAVPMTRDEKNPTYFKGTGSINAKDYINRDNKLIEGFTYNINIFETFDEYHADIDVEGYINSIVDEVRGEDATPTGRKKINLISRDFFGDILNIKNIIVPEDLVGPLEDNGGYERGATATFLVSVVPNKKVTPSRVGGIGIQRVSDSKPYLEWVVSGAHEPIDPDSDDALNGTLIKAALAERQADLDRIVSEGYLGNKNSTQSSSSRTGIGNVNRAAAVAKAATTIDDEDFPF